MKKAGGTKRKLEAEIDHEKLQPRDELLNSSLSGFFALGGGLGKFTDNAENNAVAFAMNVSIPTISAFFEYFMSREEGEVPSPSLLAEQFQALAFINGEDDKTDFFAMIKHKQAKQFYLSMYNWSWNNTDRSGWTENSIHTASQSLYERGFDIDPPLRIGKKFHSIDDMDPFDLATVVYKRRVDFCWYVYFLLNYTPCIHICKQRTALQRSWCTDDLPGPRVDDVPPFAKAMNGKTMWEWVQDCPVFQGIAFEGLEVAPGSAGGSAGVVEASVIGGA